MVRAAQRRSLHYRAMTLCRGVASLVTLLLTAGLPTANADGADQRDNEAGVPLLENIAPRDYGADAQNWAIVQDSRGLIYIANTLGVLEFDGRRWTLHRLENENTARSLAVDAEDRIHVGGSDQFGVLELDAFGQRRYRALHNRLPAGLRPSGEVRSIHVTEQGVIYNSLRQLLRVNGDQVQSWVPNSSFHFSFKVGKRVLIWEQGRGPLQLDGVELRPLAGAERLAEKRIYAALSLDSEHPDSPLLLATRRDGLFVSDHDGIRPWPTEVDAELRADLIYRGLRLSSGLIAIGTLRGLYLIDLQGRLRLHLSRREGLRDEDIFSLFEDRSGSLWLGLDNGLARLDLNAPISRFSESQGLLGRIIDLHRHQGTLYAATGRGLFHLQPGRPATFDTVEGISDQTWALLSLDQQLLVGNTNGLFSVEQGAIQQSLRSDTAVASLAPDPTRPGQVLLGLDGGLERAWRDGHQWQRSALLKGFDELVQGIVQTAPDRLWLAVHPHGIAELSVQNSGAADELSVRRWYRESDGVPARTPQRLIEWQGQWRLLGSQPTRRFNPQSQQFEPDDLLEPWSERHDLVLDLLGDDSANQPWFHAHRRSDGVPVTGYFNLDANGGLGAPTFESSLQGITVRALQSESDGLTWIGSDDGLFRYDAQARTAATATFPLLLRAVRAGTRGLPIMPNPQSPPELEYGQRSISLTMALPGASARHPSRLEARIPGAWDDWRPIRADHSLEIEGLDEGSYRLELRALNSAGHATSQLDYPFVIQPPWFRSGPFVFSALLAFALAVIGLVQWRTRSLRSRNLDLEQKVEQRTREIELSHQQLAEAFDELHRAQDELLKRERLASLGSLVAGVAHEINTPLGYSLTVISHLQTQVEGTERSFAAGKLTRSELRDFLHLSHEAVGITIRGLERGATLVQRFKQLAIEVPQDSRRALALRSLLQSVAGSVQEQCDRRHIALRIECPVELTVLASEEALHQVLRELLQNALQHAFPGEQGGQITLRAQRVAQHKVQITVADDGIGMEESVAASALEPFYTTRRHEGGVGLGLSTAHNQVLGQLNGELQLRSVAGQGTEIDLFLPAA